MNPDLTRGGDVRVSKGTVHIFRAKLLWQGACYEHIRLTNHGREPVETTLAIAFDADFVDLFEVRGMVREQRGERLPSQVDRDQAELRYLGRDARLRSTRLSFSPTPTALNEQQATFDVHLEPGAEQHLYCTGACIGGGQEAPARLTYEEALKRNDAARKEVRSDCCTIETSNPLVNLWISRSVSDLAMLTTALATCPYPYAGVPWYSTTFGRDGILTARACLWVDPSLARGVLEFLAATQATESDPQRDAEPGKILHEARRSEMARTGEIPFGRYYGTVDATPLFIALDGDKRPCRVASSNAGHALWTGIAPPGHARRIVERLMADDFFSGWGIRTVAAGEARYNPMSYHNGSVWPHDNALIAAGMARYGHTDEALRVLSALFDASRPFDGHRLPELCCGFPRRASEGPTLHPVPRSPQA